MATTPETAAPVLTWQPICREWRAQDSTGRYAYGTTREAALRNLAAAAPTATIRRTRGYFSETCWANIPEAWRIVDDRTGDEVADGSDEADARQLAARFGYVVTQVVR